MAQDTIREYLEQYTCEMPGSHAEHKALQATLFGKLRNPKASEQAKAHAQFLLICLNIRIIASLALRFRRKTSDVRDLIQVGQMALCEAMKSFDLSYDILLISYAEQGIIRAMEEALHHDATIYIPGYRKRQMGKVKFAMRMLSKAGMAVDDIDSILANIHERDEQTSLDMTKEDVQACLEAMRFGNASLDAKVSGEDSFTLMSCIRSNFTSPESGVLERETEEQLRNRYDRALSALNLIQATEPKQAKKVRMFRMHYGLDGNLPRSLEETGKHFDLSRERVRQVIEIIFGKIAKLTGMSKMAVEETFDTHNQGLLRQAA